MIGLAGTRADPVMLHFATYCVLHDIAYAVIDLVDLAARGSWSLSVPPQPGDVLSGAETVRLADLTGIYVRPIYVGTTDIGPPGDSQARWRGLLDGFNLWLEETGQVVVNRPGADQLNSVKPAHYAWLGASGLLVPASVTSCDRSALEEFAGGGRTVVKPLCGARATTRELEVDGLRRLDATEGPVMLQRLVPGDDVRVHVVGEEVLACRFTSTAIDYRSDRLARRQVTDIPAELASRLVELTAQQGLGFAGWDFKVDADGAFWCLECNPMPGYSFYDRVCGAAISAALVRLLGG